jgi:WD40 repeat protein
MKKVILVVFAITFLAWRMGAMQQGQMIVLVTGDKKQTYLEKNRALLFGTIRDLLEDMSEEDQNAPILELPVEKIQAQSALQAVINDLNWVLEVRNQMRPNETEQQAVMRIVSQMPVTQNNLQNLMVKVNGAIYLNQEALIEKYAKEIADILVSHDSMRRLARNDTTILAGIRGEIVEKCSHYIGNDFWFNVLTLNSNGPVNSASFSPDGSKIVTASSDGTATIWDAQTGVVERTLEGNDDAGLWVIRSASFSPDVSKVVTASDDKTAKIWNAQTGVLERTLAGHRTTVTAASFSPNGNKIVTASRDGTAKIWDAVTGILERTLRVGDPTAGWVNSASYSPDGNSNKIVTACSDQTAKIWNAQTEVCERTLEGHTGGVFSASYSRDGSKIVTACSDGTAKIWNAGTGVCEHTLEGHTDWVNSASFSSDGSKIVTASDDGTAKIWNAQTGVCEHTLSHTGQIKSASFSPDGNEIVTASEDGTAKIWTSLPADTIEKALFLRYLQFIKNQGGEPGWVSGWGHAIMDTFEPDKKALIKKVFPGFGSSSSSSNNNNN